MEKNNLSPCEPIIADNQYHQYQATIDGVLRKAAYRATPYPFEEDPNGPILICSYGLIDGEYYSYSSLAKK